MNNLLTAIMSSISRKPKLITLPIDCQDVKTFTDILNNEFSKINREFSVKVSENTIYYVTKHFDVIDLSEVFHTDSIMGIPVKYDNSVEFGKMEVI